MVWGTQNIGIDARALQPAPRSGGQGLELAQLGEKTAELATATRGVARFNHRTGTTDEAPPARPPKRPTYWYRPRYPGTGPAADSRS